ncbi:MAG: ankyrin repeat domain-containing protein [Candidatus Eremiobacteraeota bacterium]|nr:ankyrin repeat domain-containing protein [Candidatus Eremiobacteraeota bacterium]
MKSLIAAAALVCFMLFVTAHAGADQAEDLFGAAYKGDLAKVKALLAKNPKLVNGKGKSSGGWTALMAAARADHKDIVLYLLSKGADINAVSDEGLTLLIDAASFGKTEMAALFLSRGAAVNAKDRQGKSSLHYAASGLGNRELAAALVKSGADVNARDKSGRTPLSYAAEEGAKATAELLISHGAPINARDASGKTPLGTAVEKLKSMSLHIDRVDRSKDEQKMKELIAFLRARGAKE